MLETKLIEELNNIAHDYLLKGCHFIKTVSETDLKTEIELTINQNEISDENLSNLTKPLWNHIKTYSEKYVDNNFIFTGNIGNISENELKKWFISCLSFYKNNFTNYFYNKKLKLLTGIMDWFFSVFSTDFTTALKCNFQYHFILSPDISSSNFQCNLLWFDFNLAAKGNQFFSTYKIFYILAISLENPVINSSTSHLIEKRFINENLLSTSKFEINSIGKLLKELNFKDVEVKQIFDILMGLVELSQYRAQGDGKKLEFTGASHFKKAAEYFLIKEKQLKDFVIVEYVWQENKRKLKQPEIVNCEIDSFISAIYNVLIECIIEKFNNFSEKEFNFEESLSFKFLHSLAFPEFNKETVFKFTDYYQYYISNTIETIATEKIHGKVKQMINSSSFNNSNMKIIQPKKSLDSKTVFNTVLNFINEFKIAKNPNDYLQKLEKSNIKEIRFLKINQKYFIDIFIPEFVSFIRFSWQSFIEDSNLYCLKQLNIFVKITNISVLKNFKVKPLIGRILSSDDLANLVPIKTDFSKNEYFIHSLIDEKYQNSFKQTLKNQIININLQYLLLEPLVNEIISLKEFLNKYRILFLKYDDNSQTDSQAVQHAIVRLKLTDAWCCSDYIHLKQSHINNLDCLVVKYNENIIKIQAYGKVIIAKSKLKQLKKLSDQYREEYLEGVSKFIEIINCFTKEYLPILNVDKENIDLKLFSSLIPKALSVKRGDHNNALWLNVTIMDEMSIIKQQIFSSEKVCLYYKKNEDLTESDNCIDIGKFLTEELKLKIKNEFIIKIYIKQNCDVWVDIKTKIPLFVWNVKTDINKIQRSRFPISNGYLLSTNQYRLFQEEFIIKKLAYDSLNNVVYESFDEILELCSTAIILQPDPLHRKSLSKSPLWLLITNCLPFINLESTNTFNLVENQRKIIDKTECSKCVDYPFLRPKNDWAFENVSTKLTEQPAVTVTFDCIDNSCSDRPSTAKLNYKTAKYLNRK